MSIYIELTRRFNDGRLRAVLAGGQAVVLHRLAVMSVAREIADKPLAEAHPIVCQRATGVLPFMAEGSQP